MQESDFWDLICIGFSVNSIGNFEEDLGLWLSLSLETENMCVILLSYPMSQGKWPSVA